MNEVHEEDLTNLEDQAEDLELDMTEGMIGLLEGTSMIDQALD